MRPPQKTDSLPALRRIVQRFYKVDTFDPEDLAVLRHILLRRIEELEAESAPEPPAAD
jgi:hypothetical protein